MQRRWLSSSVKRSFLEYFKARGHTEFPSASVVPQDDASLLFVNAGMAPLKRHFLNPPAPSLVSAQRCVRAGGKHNDLEEVGHSASHLTFFEMLGNFSFGGYGREEAIALAWDFLTRELQLPRERLYVSVLQGDSETRALWSSIAGLSDAQLFECGEEDNFWSMGANDAASPCGPCTEIHYMLPDGKLLEVWNLVFMQYSGAQREPLAIPCIDTGMGLERIERVVQGVDTVFQTRAFTPIMAHASELVPKGDDVVYRAIADHARTAAVLIADGVLPSPNGRGYVLRRIVRRALRFASKGGTQGLPVLSLLLPTVVQSYPDLAVKQDAIAQVLQAEEQSFLELLPQGLGELATHFSRMQPGDELSAETVFTLHHTYGFPVELTANILAERGFSMNAELVEALREEHRLKSSDSFRGESAGARPPAHSHVVRCTSHVTTLEPESRVEAVLGDWVVIDPNPFYATSGGQLGDMGELEGVGRVLESSTSGAVRLESGADSLKSGDRVVARVDLERRRRTSVNHTATHLLHAVLTETLGDSVRQAGSYVGPDRLRFDFTHNAALEPQLLDAIEAKVQRLVDEDLAIDTQVQNSRDALADASIKSLFGERYGDQVRVVRIGEGHSTEVCGGTHASSTSEVRSFVITRASGVAKGIKRIEALTGSAAVEHLRSFRQELRSVSASLGVKPDELSGRVSKLLKTLKAQKSTKTEAAVPSSLRSLDVCSGVRLHEATDADMKCLKSAAHLLKKDHPNCVHVLVSHQEGKTHVVCASEVEESSASELLKKLLQGGDGRGGGNKNFAAGVMATLEQPMVDYVAASLSKKT